MNHLTYAPAQFKPRNLHTGTYVLHGCTHRHFALAPFQQHGACPPFQSMSPVCPLPIVTFAVHTGTLLDVLDDCYPHHTRPPLDGHVGFFDLTLVSSPCHSPHRGSHVTAAHTHFRGSRVLHFCVVSVFSFHDCLQHRYSPSSSQALFSPSPFQHAPLSFTHTHMPQVFIISYGLLSSHRSAHISQFVPGSTCPILCFLSHSLLPFIPLAHPHTFSHGRHFKHGFSMVHSRVPTHPDIIIVSHHKQAAGPIFRAFSFKGGIQSPKAHPNTS